MQNYGGWRKAEVSSLELLFEFSFLVDKSTATHNVRSISTIFLMNLPSPPEVNSMVLKLEMISGVPTSNSQKFCQFFFFFFQAVWWESNTMFLSYVGNTFRTRRGQCYVSVSKLGGIDYSFSLVRQRKEWLRLPVSASPSDSGETCLSMSFHIPSCT